MKLIILFCSDNVMLVGKYPYQENRNASKLLFISILLGECNVGLTVNGDWE